CIHPSSAGAVEEAHCRRFPAKGRSAKASTWMILRVNDGMPSPARAPTSIILARSVRPRWYAEKDHFEQGRYRAPDQQRAGRWAVRRRLTALGVVTGQMTRALAASVGLVTILLASEPVFYIVKSVTLPP